MVLPALDAEVDQVVVVLQQVVALRLADGVGDDGDVLHVGQARNLQLLEFADGGLHLHLPLLLEVVPVLVVVAGALHEVRHAAADLLGVLHRHRRDVDVAVDHAVVDAAHRRHHEDAVVVLRQGEEPGLVPDGVEGIQRLGIVQAVVEPEHVLLVLVAHRVVGDELILVRIHALPAFGAGNGGGFHVMRNRKFHFGYSSMRFLVELGFRACFVRRLCVEGLSQATCHLRCNMPAGWHGPRRAAWRSGPFRRPAGTDFCRNAAGVGPR
ncbi:MAG: hypothetical protein MOGDAGHF_01835 [Rhodocyclaceae bacterium]|nr:hypothetical protein [Rhodocyclaceae bacterium]